MFFKTHILPQVMVVIIVIAAIDLCAIFWVDDPNVVDKIVMGSLILFGNIVGGIFKVEEIRAAKRNQ